MKNMLLDDDYNKVIVKKSTITKHIRTCKKVIDYISASTDADESGFGQNTIHEMNRLIKFLGDLRKTQ